MSYLVLARKYRPQKLSEVVGQNHITLTLQNAILTNRIGHAYLFTGTRGVGKTSIGRIFAKALRCEDPETQPGGKNAGIPCGGCTSCLEVGQASSLDVIEIDGASNNGVDNVRELRETAKFLPSRGTRKVYIIDEVHMLTGAAFNALLKTLEEPPAHVVFIFATTEVHKLPATIISRCQRFDLKRVAESQIFHYLSTILQSEKITANPDAIHLIARKADGSIRDALSLLDQTIALCGNTIETELASTILGVVDVKLLAEIIQNSLNEQVPKSLASIQDSFNSGIDMKNLAIQLAEIVRDAVVCKLGAADANNPEFPEPIATMAQLVPIQTLQAIFQILTQSIHEITRSPLPKASLEMTIIRISTIGKMETLASLLQRVQNLETSSAPAISAPATSTQVTAPTNPPVQKFPVDYSWNGFVQFVTKQKPSIGTLLEHAVPITPIETWKNSTIAAIHLGFRENQAFYYEQAKASSVQEALGKLMSTYLGGSNAKKIQIDKIVIQQQTLSEKKIATHELKKEEIKQKMMNQPLIQNTREIFGAEITGFDITTTIDIEQEKTL